MDLDSSILGVVEMCGVDARCVAHAASAQVFHRARPIPGARLFVHGKGRDAAVGFAIPEAAMPREALTHYLNGDLSARLQVDTRHGVTVIKNAHLACHEGCGTFWDANTPQRRMSRLMMKWRTPLVLAALDIRWRSPVVSRSRPAGAGVAHFEIKGEVTERTAAKLLPAIEAARGQTIRLTIHSDGGLAVPGRQIYDALARHPFRVEVNIPEAAHSIASVIAMAADRRRMGTQAQMLVHESWLRAAAVNASNGPRILRALERSAAQLAAIYATACNLPIATTREWMQKETYFSAIDAVRVGLAHEVVTASGGRLFGREDLNTKSTTRPPARPARRG